MPTQLTNWRIDKQWCIGTEIWYQYSKNQKKMQKYRVIEKDGRDLKPLKLKTYWTDLHVSYLKMFRKVESFRRNLVHFNMCSVCSSGDVQTKFCLLPRFLNHVSCYSFNGWCDPFCSCWIFLIFSAYTMFLMYPHRKKKVERDLGFEVARVLVHPFQSRHQGISHLKRQSQSNWNGEEHRPA